MPFYITTELHLLTWRTRFVDPPKSAQHTCTKAHTHTCTPERTCGRKICPFCPKPDINPLPPAAGSHESISMHVTLTHTHKPRTYTQSHIHTNHALTPKRTHTHTHLPALRPTPVASNRLPSAADSHGVPLAAPAIMRKRQNAARLLARGRAFVSVHKTQRVHECEGERYSSA